MSDPDPKTTLREFREYFASTYEANNKLASRIGVRVKTLLDWLTGKYEPNHDSLAKLRAFLNAEAKRNATGDGIRPIERVPLKIVLPLRKLHYARLCPFCRKKPEAKSELLAGSNFKAFARSAERADQLEKASKKR
jgi:transcriptional regulator with XRE-family HTH domain